MPSGVIPTQALRLGLPMLRSNSACGQGLNWVLFSIAATALKCDGYMATNSMGFIGAGVESLAR